ncbi:restriction endonuclease subunit S [Candidatus Woesearchaeota archaeon]|nr:MAG: restriction endonuclease subunit S [Candidatus Woesearchaeota archaeon]
MLKFKWETEFKETEIGEIPNDWEVRKIEEIANVSTGGTPSRKNEEYWGGDISWVKSQEVRKYFIWETEEKITGKGMRKSNAKRIYLPNTVLIALYGATAGEAALLKVPATVNQAIAALEGHKTNNLFLFYLLLANKERLKDISIGSAQQNLYLKDIKNFEVALPPANDEQSRIATVLSWFDDLIENKKRQNEILEKVAMAIFKSWFVDFEPFKDEEFVYNEELGKEIPKGWEVDFATKFIDFNPPIRLIKGKVYPFVEMKQVSTNSAVCDFDYKEFTGSGVRYRGGDTLIARITPSLEHGKTAYVWFISEEEYGFGTTEFFVLHPKERYLKEFTYLLAKSDDFRDVAINSMTGTSGRQRADLNALKNFLIPIPPQSILEKFHSLVEPLFQKIILNQKQIMVLRKIRNALLPKLVFGKLRVMEI